MDGQKWMKMATRYDERKKIIFSFLFVCFVYPFGNNSKTNSADRNLGEKKLQKKKQNKHNVVFLNFVYYYYPRKKKKLIKKNGAKNTHYHSPTKKKFRGNK